MSLLDAKNNALRGFDAKNDDPNAMEQLPSGDYKVIFKGLEHKASAKGWEHLMITIQVLEGDHSGEMDFNRFSLEAPTPDNIVSASIKLIAKLSVALGFTLRDEDWENYDTLAAAFESFKGNAVEMNLSVRPNKKKPDFPYKTYNFSGIPDDPFNAKNAPEVKDSDLPFGNTPTDRINQTPDNSDRPF